MGHAASNTSEIVLVSHTPLSTHTFAFICIATWLLYIVISEILLEWFVGKECGIED